MNAMESAPFKPLKEFGSLSSSPESEIKFYVDEYRGYKYASIRTFLRREGYSGPTKAGVTLNANLLSEVLGALAKLPPEPQALEETELARFPKKAGCEFVVRVTIFKDATGIDLREWIDDGSYKGWSKKGVRIPYKDLAVALNYLRQAQSFLKGA